MADCPKCRSLMTPGFAFLPDYGVRINKWVDGEPTVWKSLAAAFGVGQKLAELTSYRCSQCGFVELYADPSAKPVKTLSTINDETERLRGLVAKLQERIAVLEAIATDPAERTSREIEKLRELPPPTEDH
jgi:predicted nucleic-acid-binding Zn-ribbon protein